MAVGTPYILLAFDEFPAIFNDGATSTIARSFCKLTIKKINGFPNVRQFARMVPDCGGEREFLPPIPNLNKLTVSFLQPDGGLISTAQDNHLIANVYLNTDAMANWILRTTDTWQTEFQAGDLITITGANTASERVNDYLNRPEGHTIIAVGNFLEVLGQYSSFVISRPYVTDPTTNGLVFDTATQKDVANLNPADTNPLTYTNMNPPAVVMNVSLQPSLSLTAVCAPSIRHETVLSGPGRL